jgi:hypothetical protein
MLDTNVNKDWVNVALCATGEDVIMSIITLEHDILVQQNTNPNPKGLNFLYIISFLMIIVALLWYIIYLVKHGKRITGQQTTYQQSYPTSGTTREKVGYVFTNHWALIITIILTVVFVIGLIVINKINPKFFSSGQPYVKPEAIRSNTDKGYITDLYIAKKNCNNPDDCKHSNLCLPNWSMTDIYNSTQTNLSHLVNNDGTIDQYGKGYTNVCYQSLPTYKGSDYAVTDVKVIDMSDKNKCPDGYQPITQYNTVDQTVDGSLGFGCNQMGLCYRYDMIKNIEDNHLQYLPAGGLEISLTKIPAQAKACDKGYHVDASADNMYTSCPGHGGVHITSGS